MLRTRFAITAGPGGQARGVLPSSSLPHQRPGAEPGRLGWTGDPDRTIGTSAASSLPPARRPPGRRRRVVAAATPVAAVVARVAAGRDRLPPAAAHRTRAGRCRHQGLPVHRPATADQPCGDHVGPEHRDGCGHPPEHRFPPPAGRLLLARRPRRSARLGRPAAVDRLGAVPGRRGRVVLHAVVSVAEQVRLRRRGRLHVEPLCPGVRGSDVGDPAAVHGPGLAARDHRPRAARGPGRPRGLAAGRLALAGRVRCHRRAGRQQQRGQPDLRAAGADAVATLCPVGDPGGPARPRAGHDRPYRCAGRAVLGLVDRGSGHPGRLRRGHPCLQRDAQDGGERLAGVGGTTRPGQLVLLRRGCSRHLDHSVA